MQIEIKNNFFIKLDNLFKINDIKANILNYSFDAKELKGKYVVTGSYVNPNEEVPVDFTEEIPFEIIFTSNVSSVSDLVLQNFEYFEVDRRGIETEFTILVYYEPMNVFQEVIEEVKNKVDQQLVENVGIIDDLEERDYPFPTNDQKTTIIIKSK